eukprot:NODE_30430_length_418_cov_3.628866.p4 GENE.NODE_30430_length_418_cov_3.628866~~NODE_30430_length_418_cov_3.628866.p4  ORF type:complete len:69 (-),score=9.80 NODE_30430_length_418_cov_3.628866:45-251(-)
MLFSVCGTRLRPYPGAAGAAELQGASCVAMPMKNDHEGRASSTARQLSSSAWGSATNTSGSARTSARA